jgi:hypothetical protein
MSKMITSATTAIWLIGGVAVYGQTDAEAAEVGQKFQKNCMHCHRPPDLQFATDQAWLDQVNRTA